MKHVSFQPMLFTIALAVVVGAGAGIVATVSTSRAIDDYAARLLDERKFSALAPTKLPTIPGTYEESLAKLRDTSSRALGVFMPVSVDSVFASAWLKEDDAKGFGVVVSADGWFLTTNTVFTPAAEAAALEVWVDAKRYAIERVVRDTSTPLVLLKLKDASALPTVGFAQSGAMKSGEMLFALSSGETSLEPVVLTNADHPILFGALKAETFVTDWSISQNLPPGTALFSGGGELAGFSLPNSRAFPLHHSSGFVTDVVRTGGARYPLFGAYVLDLAHSFNVNADLRQGRASGALVIAPSGTVRPVAKGGPANKAGIVAGDIIVDVDGEALSSEQTLAEILSGYEPGEIANVKILRGGESEVVPVTLMDQKDLLY
jgi:S1-C subfamily serine protease